MKPSTGYYSYTSLFFSFLAFTAGIVLVLALLKYGLHASYLHEALWYIVAFVFILTALSLLLSQRGGQAPEALVKYALGGTVIRLTLSIIAIYVALRLGVDDRLTFVLNFMTVYFVFLAFEIYGLLTTLRPNSEKPT